MQTELKKRNISAFDYIFRSHYIIGFKISLQVRQGPGLSYIPDGMPDHGMERQKPLPYE